jgi:hypothetical protein
MSLFERPESLGASRARTSAHHSSRPWLAKPSPELPSANKRAGLIPAHKENKHEAGCTKKFAEAQETEEAPCFEKGRSGEEIQRNGSVKID